MDAKRKGLSIGYFCQDYLKLALGREFDFSTMIYCDYGALSTSDRKQLLKIVYQHLKPGGKFLLDVFSLTLLESFQESQTWEICPDGGFWCPESYIALNRACKYPDNVTLRQTLVIANKKISNYYLWDTYFSKKHWKRRQLVAVSKYVNILVMCLVAHTANTVQLLQFC